MNDDTQRAFDQGKAVGREEAKREIVKSQPGGLAGADDEAAMQEARGGVLNFDGPELDTRRGWTTVASYSAEQTAGMLRGEEYGRPTIHDPAVAARMERQRQALRLGLFNEVIPALIRALEAESPTTAARLQILATNARIGDPRASQLMAVMIGELLTQGLQP